MNEPDTKFDTSETATVTVEAFPDLTPRQRQVALLLCEGKTSREAAERLGCSQKTVDTHRGELLHRCGVRNNVELLLLAIRRRFIVVSDEN